MEHRILDSGVNTADLEKTWEKLLEVAAVVDPKIHKNMLHGVLSWEDNDAIKLKLITAIAGM